ncbi:DUF4781 domain-containing protein [Trinickia caryophylli]|nr:DUF4781 domain-containing protein [Trinickia caryophylli]
MAIGGGSTAYVPPPSNTDTPKRPPANTANTAQTAQQRAAADAAAQTLALLKAAQAETTQWLKLRDNGASQADIDAQYKKAAQAWGAVEAAVQNQMRVAIDGGDDAKKAVASAASAIRALAPDDPTLDAVVTDSQQAVTKETAPERATNEKAFQVAIAAQKDEDATNTVAAYNALPDGKRQEQGDEYAYSITQAKNTADQNLGGTEDDLEKALRHEYCLQAAKLRLQDAKADYAAWQKEPSGARRADEADASRELSQAQTQYDKVATGDDNALTYVTADEQKQAVSDVKSAHEGAWYTGLVDVYGTQSALYRDIGQIDPNDPSLTPQMKQLAQSDPVTFALIQETGQKVDPNAPGLSPKEKALAEQNPLACAFVKMLKVDVDPTHMSDTQKKELDQLGVFGYAMKYADRHPAEKAQMQMLAAAAPDVRLLYTKQQVDLLAQGAGSDPKAALKLLNTNMNAAFSVDERQTLWNQAGLPHFDAKFIHSQIDPLMRKPDTTASDPASMSARNDSTMYADKVGKWMQGILPDAPPEFAGEVLDTVKTSFGDKWLQSNAGTPAMERGTEFYKGLSLAVEYADLQPTADGTPVKREDDVVNWLMDPKGNAQSVINILRGDSTSYGFDSVRDTVGGGYGATLSQALLKQMLGDNRFRNNFAQDFQLMLSQGIDTAQHTQQHDNAVATYKMFQVDPSKTLAPYFNDFQQHYDNAPHTFSANSTQLTNFIGAGLGIQPDDPGVVPTDAKDNPSMATLVQLIVGNGTLNNNALANGRSLYGGNDAATKMIDTVADHIRKVGGDHPAVTLVPTYYVSKASGASPSALFKVEVEGKPGEYRYVDDRGWEYDGIDNYQHDNALSDDAKLYVPKDVQGAKVDGSALYGSIDAHITTGWQHVEHALEITTGILAAAGSVVLVASGVGAVVAEPLMAGAWIAIGAGMAVGVPVATADLYNLREHGQSIGFGNAQARADWVSLIGAGTGAASGGLGFATKSLAEAASLLRVTGEVSDQVGAASGMIDEATALSGTARFAHEATAFEGLANTTQFVSKAFNVAGIAAGTDLLVEQGASLLRNWDAMSGSERAKNLLQFGLGLAQSAAGSRTVMERPLHAMLNVPKVSPTVTDAAFRPGFDVMENQRRSTGGFGDPRRGALEGENEAGGVRNDGLDLFEIDKGLDAKAVALRQTMAHDGLQSEDAAGGSLLVRLAPDSQGESGAVPLDGGTQANSADPLAAPSSARAGAAPASWPIPANVRSNTALLEQVIISALRSGSGLDGVQFYVYALRDEQGRTRVPEEEGLPATDEGDLGSDLHAARVDERRAAASANPAAAARATEAGEPLDVTRYRSFQDALMVGSDGVLAGRYGLALVDRSAVLPNRAVGADAIVGRIAPNANGTRLALTLNEKFEGDLRILYPRNFAPGKPLIRAENGRRIDAVNALPTHAETQWAAYPRREADLAIYSDDPRRPENMLPAGERPLLPVPPGHFAVYCHAWTDAFAASNGRAFDPEEMANLIHAAGWDGHSPVILYACGAASRLTPLSQLLANVLGVDVYGGSGFVAWRSPFGKNGLPASGYTTGLVVEPGAYDRTGKIEDAVLNGPRVFRFMPGLPIVEQGGHPIVGPRAGRQTPRASNRLAPVEPIVGEHDGDPGTQQHGIIGAPDDEPGTASPNARLSPEPPGRNLPEPFREPPVVLEGDRIFTAEEWEARGTEEDLSGKTQTIYPKDSKAYTRRALLADGSGVVTTLARDGRALIQPGFDDVTGLSANEHPEFLRPAETLLMPPDDPLHAVGERGLMSPPGHHVIFGHGISPDEMLGPDGHPITVDDVAARVAASLEPGQDVTLYSCYAGSPKAAPLRAAQARRGPRTNAAFADALAQRLADATGRPVTVWAPPDKLLVWPDGTATVRLTRLTGETLRVGAPMTAFRATPLYRGFDHADTPRASSVRQDAANEPRPHHRAPHSTQRPTTPRVTNLRLDNPYYDFSPIADDSFDSVLLSHEFGPALADRPGVLGDVARVTRPGGTVSLERPSGFLDEPRPAGVIDALLQTFSSAGLTRLRVRFVTGRESSIDIGNGFDIGALDPEDGYFVFSGEVPDEHGAGSRAAADAAAHANVGDDALSRAFDKQQTAQRPAEPKRRWSS